MTEEVKLRHGKTQEGVVARTTMNKTVVVEVTRQVQHPLFQKIVRRTRNFLVHDEKNECKVGDKVRIVETSPISKTKRWKLREIVSSNALGME
jgi:small subunit ribosomal protein S17